MDEPIYFVCRTPFSPVRKELSDTSEMVTQILFGELVLLLEEKENWLHIRSIEDNYLGFVDRKQFIQFSTSDFMQWKSNRRRSFETIQLFTPSGLMNLPTGCFIGNNEAFNFSQNNYSIFRKGSSYSDWKAYAFSFLNTPYLWGGRTTYGIDCSGFSQQMLAFRGIELPRDASQQALKGIFIQFEDRKAGDLAFFHNKDNKIVHVGILTDLDLIIHASGFVKEDRFTQEGIVSKETGKLTHHLDCIKRFN